MSHAALGLGQAAGAALADSYGHGCAAGTSILTLDGALPVEFLCAGDRIITRNGARRLVQMTANVCVNAALVRVSPDSLGVGKPADDIVIAPDQPILIRDWRAKALYAAAQAMVPAARLIDGSYIRAETVTEARLYSLHFDEPAVIYAGGLELGCAPLQVLA